jgi:hypothetical protein
MEVAAANRQPVLFEYTGEEGEVWRGKVEEK